MPHRHPKFYPGTALFSEELVEGLLYSASHPQIASVHQCSSISKQPSRGEGGASRCTSPEESAVSAEHFVKLPVHDHHTLPLPEATI